MGNRHGSEKQKDAKSKEEKKRVKEAKKEHEKRRKRKEKEKKKKKLGGQHAGGSGLDTDLEESSHVTGGDSESSVFHSAENVSSSPYLNACTRSELEQGPCASTLPGGSYCWPTAPSSASGYQLYHHHQQHHLHLHQQQQHPMVLSSKDFRDGFSLEACIPPEIARRETFYHDDVSSSSVSTSRVGEEVRGRSGSSVKSKRSNNSDSVKSKSSKASGAAVCQSPYNVITAAIPARSNDNDSASMTSSQTSAYGGGGAAGYSTPLLSTPVFGHVERSQSPLQVGTSSPLTRVQEVVDPGVTSQVPVPSGTSYDSRGIPPYDNQYHSHYHHPHFFNHQRNQQQQQQQQQHQQKQQPQNQQQSQSSRDHQRQQSQKLQQQQQNKEQHKQQQQKEQHNSLQASKTQAVQPAEEKNIQFLPNFRNLPKPTSPYPQRRALSPKMTSAPLNLISSDDSSSSPTTPVPQRRAANIFSLFRPATKTDRGTAATAATNQAVTPETTPRTGQTGRGLRGAMEATASVAIAATPRDGVREAADGGKGGDGAGRSRLRPKWMTWERASSKKSSDKPSKVSMIFGTIRKTDKKNKSNGVQSSDHSGTSRLGRDTTGTDCGKTETGVEKESETANRKVKLSTKFTGYSIDAKGSGVAGDRNSSPPVAKSAAFCIMRLEELERNIEKTIKEKFPDAEPFLLKKRSKEEELKGSRSLPTTPSLKKKLFIVRDVDRLRQNDADSDVASSLNAVSSKLNDVTTDGDARWCDAKYECLPSPAMSPVVLRRFGARTRHASISPKIQRVKTAALYSSPNEMARVEEGYGRDQNAENITRSLTTVNPSDITKNRAPNGSPISASGIISPLVKSSQKSQSKYDNVMDDSEDEGRSQYSTIPTSIAATISSSLSNASSVHVLSHRHADEYDSDECEDRGLIMTRNSDDEFSGQKPVIVPTFSAVFGSVSPKLRRHLQTKFDDIERESGRKKIKQGGGSDVSVAASSRDYVHQPLQGTSVSKGLGESVARNKPDTGSSSRGARTDPREMIQQRTPSHDSAYGTQKQTVDRDRLITTDQLDGSKREIKRDEANASQVGQELDSKNMSVKARVKSINKSVPVGAGSGVVGDGTAGNGAGGATVEHPQTEPSHSHLRTTRERRRPERDIPTQGVPSYVPLSRKAVTKVSDSGQRTNVPGGNAPSASEPQPRRNEASARAEGSAEHSVVTITSPRSARKHSADHVVFGTAIALPCRMHAPPPLSPSPANESNANNVGLPSAPAQDGTPSSLDLKENQTPSARNVKKQKVENGGDGSGIGSSYGLTRSAAAAAAAAATTAATASTKAARGISCSSGSSSSSNRVNADGGAVLEVRGVRSVITVPVTVYPTTRGGHSAEKGSSYVPTEAGNVTNDSASRSHRELSTGGVGISREGEQSSKPGGDKESPRHPRQEEKKQFHDVDKHYRPSCREDEQKYLVLRQPVSQVICDMINVSKQTDQQQQKRYQNQQQQQLQQRKLHQSSPTSPEQERHVESVVTMVTTPAYQQECLTLEEKTVRSDKSSTSLPSSPISNLKRIERDFSSRDPDSETAFDSRCAGSQTDSLSTAEKGVESSDLLQSAEIQSASVLGRVPGAEEDTTLGVHPLEAGGVRKKVIQVSHTLEEGEEEERKAFVHTVIAFQRMDGTRRKVAERRIADGGGEDVESGEQAPPPPSPSAMEQLLEDFEEEDEDGNAEEKMEIERALRQETEIKLFTDKIYKRLSDLLGSQSGDTEDVEDDVFEEDLKKSTLAKSYVASREEDSSDQSDQHQRGPDLISPSKASPRLSREPSARQGLQKVLTIQSSSSSLTTTTSSSEEEETYSVTTAFLQQQQQQSLPMEDHQHGQQQKQKKKKLRQPSEVLGDMEEAEGAPKRKAGPNYFVFPECSEKEGPDREFEIRVISDRRRSNSRDYHSDDDVARGQGIPDYYDDRPLWSRRHKLPGQLSMDMMAIRRRERRERWLKKRRRNRTDLLSAGSSDTGSEVSLRECPRRRSNDSSLDYGNKEDNEFSETKSKNLLGSGILSSPKYSKPILPFLAEISRRRNESSSPEPRRRVVEERIHATYVSEELQASYPYLEYEDHRGGSFSGGKHSQQDTYAARTQSSGNEDNDNSDDDFSNQEDGVNDRLTAAGFVSDPSVAIPGIEETFNELISVKHILEGLQDRTASSSAATTGKEEKILALTTENVKSVRDYYKDVYSSGNGRRSRMSNTDRTESDLDLYSEHRDDASSDSNIYADDEDDDEGIDPYTTADDDVDVPGRSDSDGCRHGRYSGGVVGDGGGGGGGGGIISSGQLKSRRIYDNYNRNDNDDDDDDNEIDEDFVVSCTFYNSNSFPSAESGGGGATPVPPATSSPAVGSSGKITPRSYFTPSGGTMGASSAPPTLMPSVLNSDEEFWEGSAAFNSSFSAVQGTSGNVNSTFQNAREQMIDIQHHLQALRRQMEDLEPDPNSPASVARAPDMS